MTDKPRQNNTYQRDVQRSIRALKAEGLEVRGIEYLGDGRFRVLTAADAQADVFEEWKRKRSANVT